MTYIILLFGIFLIISGIILIIRPGLIIGQLIKHQDSFSLHFWAVSLRIGIGVACIAGAIETKYPLIMLFFGWLSIISALALGVMGRKSFKHLINWTIRMTSWFQRLMGFLAFLLGFFFIYAVI